MMSNNESGVKLAEETINERWHSDIKENVLNCTWKINNFVEFFTSEIYGIEFPESKPYKCRVRLDTLDNYGNSKYLSLFLNIDQNIQYASVGFQCSILGANGEVLLKSKIFR